MSTRPADTWSPLYFLASVGAGGVSVSFFMWLMHWLPHPGRTVPTFEDIAAAFAAGGLHVQAMIAVAMIAIAVMAFLNLKLLVWNLNRYTEWRRTEAYEKFAKTNAQSQLMALPLALAMSINGAFVAGLVFVPGLWSVIEYLFPLALVGFAAVAVLAYRIYGTFLGRVLVDGGFNTKANNNFGQLLPAFAFAMTGVGMAAPAALSGNATIAGISLIASSLLFVTTVLIAAIGLVLAFRDMLDNGTNAETAPTLLIVLPLMTILGILALRQSHGLDTHFAADAPAADSFMMLTQLIAVQVVFALFGLLILARQNYYRRFLFGAENSPAAYALVCPGVAFAVLMQFFINKGLVGVGLVEKFGTAYWAVTAVALAAQLAMLWLVFHLNRRHFAAPRASLAVPAE